MKNLVRFDVSIVDPFVVKGPTSPPLRLSQKLRSFRAKKGRIQTVSKRSASRAIIDVLKVICAC